MLPRRGNHGGTNSIPPSLIRDFPSLPSLVRSTNNGAKHTPPSTHDSALPLNHRTTSA